MPPQPVQLACSWAAQLAPARSAPRTSAKVASRRRGRLDASSMGTRASAHGRTDKWRRRSGWIHPLPSKDGETAEEQRRGEDNDAPAPAEDQDEGIPPISEWTPEQWQMVGKIILIMSLAFGFAAAIMFGVYKLFAAAGIGPGEPTATQMWWHNASPIKKTGAVAILCLASFGFVSSKNDDKTK